MLINKTKFKSIFITTLTIFIILSSIFIGLKSSTKTIEKKAQILSLRTSESYLVTLEKKLLQKEFNRLIADIYLLKETVEHAHSTEDIKSTFESIVRNKKIYDQLRYIDETGQEIVRIDLKDNQCMVCPTKKLQNKKDRYYFKDTMKIGRDCIYISKLDLNMENGKIEDPIKPMIRISAKVFDNKGEERGIVISNYYANAMIEDFKSVAEKSMGDIYLLNSNSYWIHNAKNRETEYAFMYEDKNNINFYNLYPDIWNNIVKNPNNIIKTKDDIFFSEEVIAFEDEIGDYYSFPLDKIILGEGNLIIVSHINKHDMPDVFPKSSLETVKDIIFDNKEMIALVLLISFLLSILLRMYVSQKNKTKFLSEHDPMTGAFNRRAGLEKIRAIIKSTRNTDISVAIIFIDVNGLKSVNDVLGHIHGDNLIKSVSAILQKCMRDNDLLIRFGGDEFVVCIKKIDLEHIEKLWQRILSRINSQNETSNLPYNISISHGVSIIEGSETNVNIQDKIELADKRMYDEKEEIKKTAIIIK